MPTSGQGPVARRGRENRPFVRPVVARVRSGAARAGAAGSTSGAAACATGAPTWSSAMKAASYTFQAGSAR